MNEGTSYCLGFRSYRNNLPNIPQPYKDVFMLRVFAELSYKQIGQNFSKSEN